MFLAITACSDRSGGLSLTVDGAAERIDAVSHTIGIRSGAHAITLELGLDVDPDCDAVDDERTYSVALRMWDVTTVPVGVEIDLAEAATSYDPFTVRVRERCACEALEPDPKAVSGWVRFEALTEDQAQGSISVAREGPTDARGSGDLLIEGTFEAPLETSSRCQP